MISPQIKPPCGVIAAGAPLLHYLFAAPKAGALPAWTQVRQINAPALSAFNTSMCLGRELGVEALGGLRGIEPNQIKIKCLMSQNKTFSTLLRNTRMKIVGGDFGDNRILSLNENNDLVINGAGGVTYSPEQIQSIEANANKEKRFGINGFIVGAVALSVLFWIFFGLPGIIVALVVAFPCGYIGNETNNVNILFKDNKSVNLECSAEETQELLQLADIEKTNQI